MRTAKQGDWEIFGICDPLISALGLMRIWGVWRIYGAYKIGY